jgi:hypothetical protein
MNDSFPRAHRSGALALLLVSCGGGSPTQPPAPPPTTLPAAQPSPSPSPSPSASPAAAGCPFAPGPVTRLAIAPRALQSNGANAPMRTRLVAPGEELLCLESEKSHRIDFNLNQRNELGQECCWVDSPGYRIRGDTAHIVTGSGAIDDNGFIFRVRVEPRGQNEATFGVEATLDGVPSHPWLSGGQYPLEPLRVITLPGDEIARLCPCIYLGNGGYEGGSCQR